LIKLFQELKTISLPNDLLTSYLQNLKEYDNDGKCFESEECAEKWMHEYNFAYEKIMEKSSLLKV